MLDVQQYTAPSVNGCTTRPVQNALPEGESYFRATFAQSAVGIAHLGLDGRWLRVNHRLCDLVEHTEQNLLHRTIQDITHPDDRDAQRTALHRVLIGASAAHTGEYRCLRPSGSLVWLRLAASLVRDQSGVPGYFIVVADDITARKQEEERAMLLARECSARESAERAADRFQQVLDVLPEGVIVADAQGQVLMSNRAARDIVGRDVMGRFMPADDGEAHEIYRARRPDGTPYPAQELPWQRTLRYGEVVRDEQVLILHGTTSRETALLLNSVPLRDAAGTTSGAVITFQDITILKNLERAHEESIEETAHDLKTPLTTIRGNAVLVRDRLARGRAPDIAAVTAPLDAIEAATLQMAALIDELRRSIGAQAGGPLPLDRRPTDLVALVRVLIARQHGLTPHRVHLESTVPALVVVCDAIRVERAVANLLSNAITYSPAGGDITVEITAEHDASGAWAVIMVQDQGVGIPAADLPHIFERSYRGRNVAGRIPGTGIGLASVRQIVAQHGGSVAAKSREGVGSTVTMRLPLERMPLAH